MIIIHIRFKHLFQLTVRLLDFPFVPFQLHIDFIDFLTHRMVFCQYLFQLLAQITKQLSEQTGLFLDFLNVKLGHNFCQRIQHDP